MKLVKLVKVLLAVWMVGAVVWVLGRRLADELRDGRGADDVAGVQLAVPPGFSILDLGDSTPAGAAQRLAAELAARPAEAQLGVRFRHGAGERWWLVDRRDPGAVTLVEMRAGDAGTRVETTWRGGVERRLAAAAAGGELDAAGLPPGERRNLYH